MRAAIFNGPRRIDVGDRPDPAMTEPTDAVVRVVLACVCGSDLWYYRGESPKAPGAIGHEFIGFVEQVGPAVTRLAEGDLVIAPFHRVVGTVRDTGKVNDLAERDPGTPGIVGTVVSPEAARSTLRLVPR